VESFTNSRKPTSASRAETKIGPKGLTTRFGENFLDLLIYREAANFSFGENHLAVYHHIELTCLTRLYLDFLPEARVK
jgi:hypothetical protein